MASGVTNDGFLAWESRDVSPAGRSTPGDRDPFAGNKDLLHEPFDPLQGDRDLLHGFIDSPSCDLDPRVEDLDRLRGLFDFLHGNR